MILGCENLTVELGGRPVLRDVSMRLKPGKITVICGPNGAGKSTLLSALAGLQSVTEGDALLDMTSVSRLAPRTRAQTLGYLAQDQSIVWDVSVETLVRLGRLPHRDRGDDAVERALTALDLVPFRNRVATRLSGGERARVLLARVLAGEPEWILADEPLAALDLAHQQSLIVTLRKQAMSGVGVVLVLHDLALAMNHADRVVVLHDGEVLADDVPAIALAAPVIEKGWGVSTRWVGQAGAQALAIFDAG